MIPIDALQMSCSNLVLLTPLNKLDFSTSQHWHNFIEDL
jgi:hypothetical protein